MTAIFKKTVDGIYSFLLADAAGEFNASTSYKTLFIFLAVTMVASAAYAVAFMPS